MAHSATGAVGHAAAETQKADGLEAFFKTFEDEHHHPKSGLLWVVLLAFTLLEVGGASTFPTSADLNPGALSESAGAVTIEGSQLIDGQALAQQIVSEAKADATALENWREVTRIEARLAALKAAGKKESDPEYKKAQDRKVAIQPFSKTSGRPSARLLELVGPEGRKLIEDYASLRLDADPSSAARQRHEKDSALAALINEKILTSTTFFNAEAFAGVEVGVAVANKLNRNRRDGASPIKTFLGDPGIEHLNRELLELAYPRAITSPSISRALIIVLMAFAILKALVVAFYFMHGRYEGTWLKILIVPSLTLAFVVVVFLAPDIGRVHHKAWVIEFLVPMALLILVAFGLVLKLTRSSDMPQMEPAAH